MRDIQFHLELCANINQTIELPETHKSHCYYSSYAQFYASRAVYEWDYTYMNMNLLAGRDMYMEFYSQQLEPGVVT